MNFITFNAVREDVSFRLVVPVSDIMLAVDVNDGSSYSLIVKGSHYLDLGNDISPDNECITRIQLQDSKGIDVLSKKFNP